jgi:23S rRNA (cytidine1920-2'-O)/16S rRNA (cytidine1409-2'-O)-methyltransferase
VDKPGRTIPISSEIKIKDAFPPYVSRGGTKLAGALACFTVEVEGKTILDVGASTGGFTDCLLKNGAARVIAVDVGYGQLHWSLQNDSRVLILDRTNIRHLTLERLGETAHGAVIDVSFISLKLVIPAVAQLIKPEAFIIALVKPQFEVGREHVGKGGVVRDSRLHSTVLDDLKSFFREQGWSTLNTIPSPIKGPKGNREFFVHLERA